MPEHVWSVLCYKASVDKVTNSVSLLDVYEGITLQNTPDLSAVAEAGKGKKDALFPMQMDLMTLWVRSEFGKPESGSYRLVLQPPEGKKVTLADEVPIDLNNHPRSRNRVQMPVMLYRGPGVYYFLVSLRQTKGWKRVAKVPLDISLSEEVQKQLAELDHPAVLQE